MRARLQKILLFCLNCFVLSHALGFVTSVYASSTHSLFGLTFSIISYSQFENSPTTNLCVFDQSGLHQRFVDYAQSQRFLYTISLVNSAQWSQKSCDIVFFADQTPQQQQQLINTRRKPQLLSFSQHNLECEVGSSFCLYTKKDQSSAFKVNLDSLTHSKVRVDPRVLLLAKNSE